MIHQLLDGCDLLANDFLGAAANLGRAAGHAGGFRRQADEVHGVFQVVDDRSCKPSDQGRAFGLKYLSEVLAIELAEAAANLPQRPLRHHGRMVGEQRRSRNGGMTAFSRIAERNRDGGAPF